MKQSVKKILDDLYEEETLTNEILAEEALTTDDDDLQEETPFEVMRGLVLAGLAGDQVAWGIWSDLWKDDHGVRPRYSIETIKWMYGID